jgi:ankyrin repeat protein
LIDYEHGKDDIYAALVNACKKKCEKNKTQNIVEIVRLLIEKGEMTEEALTRQDNNDKNTCLMYACIKGNIDILCELLYRIPFKVDNCYMTLTLLYNS